MSVTSYGDTMLDAIVGRVLIVAALPVAAADYYGTGAVGHDEWRGGEVVYLSTDEKLYINTAESGQTAVFLVLDSAFATSTTSSTSSSTSTSSSSSSSSSTSSSSSSTSSTSTSSTTTSTSSSTSSSSSSSSTSSSSTTTA